MTTCPICNNQMEFENVYSSTTLSIAALYEKEQDDFPVTEMRIEKCKICNFVVNTTPAEVDYGSKNYKSRTLVNTNKYLELLGLETKLKIGIEIGCGTNPIIHTLSHVYSTIDPSTSIEQDYNHLPWKLEDSIAQFKDTADITVARHVLEHVKDINQFILDIIEITKENGLIYIEVPNFREINAYSRCIDIFNDHISYFDADNLSMLGMYHNLSPIKRIYLYQDQHVGVLFKKKMPISTRSMNLMSYDYNSYGFDTYIRTLERAICHKDKIAMWGAGAHGNALLDCLEEHKITECFDLDKNKHGLYMLNNVKIVPPTEEFLSKYDTIVIASALHEQEIARGLRNKNIIYTAKGIYEINPYTI